MQSNKSNNSAAFVGIGSLVVLAGFFLPWVVYDMFITKLNISGLDFANGDFYLWLMPVAALVGLGWAIYVVTQGGSNRSLAYVAGGAAILALLGVIIFLIQFNQGKALASSLSEGLIGAVFDEALRDMLKLQYGYWVTLVGAVIMVIGAVMGFTVEEAYPVVPTIPMPPMTYTAPPATSAAPIPPTVAVGPSQTYGPAPQPQRQPTQQIGVPAAPEGWLVLRNGSRAGQQFGLTRGRKNTVGRDPSRADIIVDDNTISGEHARVQFEQGQFYLYDLASTNGTFVNNRRVQRQMLMDNDIVRLGDMQFVFKRVS